jgi:hypothetical protein
MLANGIILARRDAPFLAKWGRAYENDYRPTKWGYNSCSTKLWKKFPNLVHVEMDSILRPNWRPANLRELWGDATFDWKKSYAVHTYLRLRNKVAAYKERYGDLYPGEEDYRKMNNTVGEIVRWLLSL